MAYTYLLRFIPTGYIHPKTMTGKGFGVTTSEFRWALDNPINSTSRVVRREGQKIDYYIIYSIQQIASPNGLAYLLYRNFGNKEERDIWVSETMNNIQSGKVLPKPFHGGSGGTNISEVLSAITNFPNDRIDQSTGLFLKGKEGLYYINEVMDLRHISQDGKIYGAAVIIIDNKQASDLVTFEMQVEKPTSTTGTGFERGQAYQTPVTEPTIISGVKPFEKPERVSVFEPKKTLSPQIKKIIDDWSVKKIIVPAWFANNNMNWVLEGRITEQEFLNAYTNLVKTGVITSTTPQVTIAPIPEITIPSIPEVSAEIELITTNFQVKLDNIIQFSSSLSNADYKRLQDEMSLEPKITLVFLNQTEFNPLSNFSKILKQIQNLLQKQVGETIPISPTGEVITAPEPTVAGKPGLMGAGVLGLIGILMLGGFIADHVRKRK